MNLFPSIQNKLLQFVSVAFQIPVSGREASLSRSYETLVDYSPNQTHRKAKNPNRNQVSEIKRVGRLKSFMPHHTRHQGRLPTRQSDRISAINQAKTSSGRTLTGRTELCRTRAICSDISKRPQSGGHSRRNSIGSVIEVIASASGKKLRRSARIKAKQLRCK
jgi:hypothetical protein